MPEVLLSFTLLPLILYKKHDNFKYGNYYDANGTVYIFEVNGKKRYTVDGNITVRYPVFKFRVEVVTVRTFTAVRIDKTVRVKIGRAALVLFLRRQ